MEKSLDPTLNYEGQLLVCVLFTIRLVVRNISSYQTIKFSGERYLLFSLKNRLRKGNDNLARWERTMHLLYYDQIYSWSAAIMAQKVT